MILAAYICLAWIVQVAVNIFIAWWNNEIRIHRIKVGNTKQIEHPLWAAIYCALCAPWWFAVHDFYFMGSILLLHLSVFPVAYNRYAIPDLSPFYLSKTSKAWTDMLQVKLGFKTMAPVNISAFILSIALLIKSIL